MPAPLPAAWVRVVAWARKNAPAMLANLQPGASDATLAALERDIGRPLPPTLRALLQLHDGEVDDWPHVFGPYGTYYSAERIGHAWKERFEVGASVAQDRPDPEELIRDGIIFVEGPVRPDMFRREWIPFMDFNGDIFWAVDFAPAAGGAPGQVIQVDWEACEWKVLAPSLDAFLDNYAKALESGEFKLVDGIPQRDEE